MAKEKKYRFRRVDNIGAADAEEDKKFLENCFIDTGDLAVLRDCSDPKRIVVGRTGSGKTALLQKLVTIEERVIEIKPESLALSYISNSNILQFFSELGVKLDIFFRLLWRHVFTVEILKYHFKIKTEQDKRTFLQKIYDKFTDKKNREALKYLEKWGKSFWEETEYRIKELTTQLESDLKSSVESKIPALSFEAGAGGKLSKKQKEEIVHRAQKVVNNVQIRQLSDIIELIDQVLTDPQKRYYIVIDRLDENWVSDSVRYRLIRALIETARDFRKVRHAKIILALRLDLLERVFKRTRDAGFQEEKYESLYLQLDWTEDLLRDLIDSRISFLVQHRYTKRKVTYKDIFPRKIAGVDVIKYIVSRSMMRPREVIQFVNLCIQKATGRSSITVQMIREAEGEYSRLRLKSIADEWYADYPNLITFVLLLKKKRKHFSMNEISRSECEEFCLDVVIKGFETKDILSESAVRVVDCAIDYRTFLKTIFEVFYHVGIIGLKLESYEKFIWSISGRRSISSAEISESTRLAIHPCFWRVLGIYEK